MGAKDLNLYSMMFVYLLLIVPLIISLLTKIKFEVKILISVIRMTIQLGLIGLYLNYVFQLNNLWINLGWVTIMAVVSSYSMMGSCRIKAKYLLFPILASILLPLLATIFYFNHFIIGIDNVLSAKYLIPISGMLLGNTMRGNIIATNTFLNYFRSNEKEYYFALSLGASKNEALRPIVRSSITSALSPSVATMATIGLVSLPGMMTGQILGGSVPMTAIKYQIAIMVAIFTSMSMSVYLLTSILQRKAFDKFDILRKDIFKK